MNRQIAELFSQIGLRCDGPLSIRTVSQSALTRVHQVTVEDAGQSFCVKSTELSAANHLVCEYKGLELIRAADSIAVPKVFSNGVTRLDSQAWFVSQWIFPESAVAAPTKRTLSHADSSESFFVTFGRQLANLHRMTMCQQIGLNRDNYLGSARQINSFAVNDVGVESNWIEFFATRRLEVCLRRAVDDGSASGRLRRAVGEVIGRLPGVLAGGCEETCLLHGDLWSGNYLRAAGDTPVLIDPAVYYGAREAEFGMLMLYGSCPQEFYDTYENALPLAPGWQRRTNVYVLYHLLNHLNLFGGAYLSQCERAAEAILRD